jgi:hypothetical protein
LKCSKIGKEMYSDFNIFGIPGYEKDDLIDGAILGTAEVSSRLIIEYYWYDDAWIPRPTR